MQLIVGDIDGPAENVFFIQSGKCKVVREITMIRSESSSGKTKLKLPPVNFTENDIDTGNNKDKVVKKFLTIHMLKKGDFFGVGEDLKKTFIISVGRVSEDGVNRRCCDGRIRARLYKTIVYVKYVNVSFVREDFSRTFVKHSAEGRLTSIWRTKRT